MIPNHYGRYKKADVIAKNYSIFSEDTEGVLTATEIKEAYGINIQSKDRLKHCVGFRCSNKIRGCVPVFDIIDITIKYRDGLL
ncbi:hypothetical protein [Bacillus cereus group sp. BfR-BA-00415]|uniref:hypothetical protein n=1 Tax=Bacillus cereus group sp. BfR-BA-00415 TaxID=3094867 RepID=UPI0029C3A767|nr:hypothetical protein [Bacillus cereus group sp. BfR-BA-00415]MDX5942349.1 hypothetical protein [Bacillus cereus group sp. BfR-BA-00415]